MLGGVGEIRTHGTIARTTPFQGVTIGLSVTTPVFGATTIFLCRLLLSEGSSCMWPHKNGAAVTFIRHYYGAPNSGITRRHKLKSEKLHY